MPLFRSVAFTCVFGLMVSCSRMPGQRELPAWQFKPAGNGTSLTWNRNAPELRNHDRVILVISDGGRQREFALDRSTGTLFYAPLSAETSYTLRLESAAGQVEKALVIRNSTGVEPPSVDRARGAETYPISISTPGEAEVRTQVKVLDRPSPELPAKLVRRFKRRHRPVTIEVFVKISPEGKVVAASTAKPPSSLHRQLANAATDAALRWKFEPPQVAGRKVSADAKLYFQF